MLMCLPGRLQHINCRISTARKTANQPALCLILTVNSKSCLYPTNEGIVGVGLARKAVESLSVLSGLFNPDKKPKRLFGLRQRYLIVTYLFSVYTPRHGPGRGDVVHDSFTQALGHLVELEEVPDAVQHLMVTIRVGIHLLEDGCHVTKDGGVKKGWEDTEKTRKGEVFIWGKGNRKSEASPNTESRL